MMTNGGGVRRSPLVVLSEASFPDHVSTPWSRSANNNNNNNDDDDDDDNGRGQNGAVIRGAVVDGRRSSPNGNSLAAARGSGASPKTMPMATLALPLVPLAHGDEADCVASVGSRDVDAEVGATTDTLRELGMLSVLWCMLCADLSYSWLIFCYFFGVLKFE